MVDSKALTKTQSAILVAIIAVAAAGGVLYILLSEENQTSETIKIGVLADLDGTMGRNIWQGVVLAAEQTNSEGGILGKQIKVVAEDHDFESGQDMAKISAALTRLITFHNADFIIGQVDGQAGFVCQDLIADHKKIFFTVVGFSEPLTQRVLDDYDKYKYFFRVFSGNSTASFMQMIDGYLSIREETGLNKVGYIAEDLDWNEGIRFGIDSLFSDVYGFDLVYKGTFPLGTVDFSSYFAAAEAAETEILIPLIANEGGIPFIKEYYDRQSPLLVYGGVLNRISFPESWEWTDGKCEHAVIPVLPVAAKYPFTTKTLSTSGAYENRWNESALGVGSSAYDVIRFILPDAIERAGTIESDIVVEALESINVETSIAREFVFTKSHDIMYADPNDPNSNYMLVMLFQWQDGVLVPVYPKWLMEEAGATYTFPDWPGPWD